MILWDCEISVCRHPLGSVFGNALPQQRADKSFVDSRRHLNTYFVQVQDRCWASGEHELGPHELMANEPRWTMLVGLPVGS